MRYFSPSVLDGSITTAKLADDAVTSLKIANGAVTTLKLSLSAVEAAQIAPGAVGTTKLTTITDSQSGSIAATDRVDISLSAYAFFPDIEIDNSGAPDSTGGLQAVHRVPAVGSADSPQFQLENTDNATRNYSVAWRRVSG